MSYILHIPYNSIMDKNLEDQWVDDGCSDEVEWCDYLLLFDGVLEVCSGVSDGITGTVVTFKSEEYKTFFILRWT